jgi:hypothetical protein
MIPILPREAGVDGGEGVVLMEDLSIEGIGAMIEECSNKEPEELRRLSQQATQRAERDFTESAFEARWIQMLREVIPASTGNRA